MYKKLLKNHVFDFGNVVIGSSLEAVCYAYSHGYSIVWTRQYEPFPWEYLTPKNGLEKALFEEGSSKDLYNKLLHLLSFAGKSIYHGCARSIGVDLEENEITIRNEIYPIVGKFKKLHIFDIHRVDGVDFNVDPKLDKDKIIKVVDWFGIDNAHVRYIDEIDTMDDFVKKIYFYESPRDFDRLGYYSRIDGVITKKTYKDCVTVSYVKKKYLYARSYSFNYARLIATRLIKESDVITNNKRPILDFIEREKREDLTPGLISTKKIKFVYERNINKLLQKTSDSYLHLANKWLTRGRTNLERF